MNHVARGLIVLLALLAAGVCGVSLETSLFEESPQLAVEAPTPHDDPEQPAAKERRSTAFAPGSYDLQRCVLIEANLSLDLNDLDLGIGCEAMSVADASCPERSNVMMHPKVQLWNGQGLSASEPCDCRCKTRCSRRWVRCRVR